jgi:hypothetical protein
MFHVKQLQIEESGSLSAPLAGEVPRSGEGGWRRALIAKRKTNKKQTTKGKKQTTTTKAASPTPLPAFQADFPRKGGQITKTIFVKFLVFCYNPHCQIIIAENFGKIKEA